MPGQKPRVFFFPLQHLITVLHAPSSSSVSKQVSTVSSVPSTSTVGTRPARTSSSATASATTSTPSTSMASTIVSTPIPLPKQVEVVNGPPPMIVVTPPVPSPSPILAAAAAAAAADIAIATLSAPATPIGATTPSTAPATPLGNFGMLTPVEEVDEIVTTPSVAPDPSAFLQPRHSHHARVSSVPLASPMASINETSATTSTTEGGTASSSSPVSTLPLPVSQSIDNNGGSEAFSSSPMGHMKLSASISTFMDEPVSPYATNIGTTTTIGGTSSVAASSSAPGTPSTSNVNIVDTNTNVAPVDPHAAVSSTTQMMSSSPVSVHESLSSLAASTASSLSSSMLPSSSSSSMLPSSSMVLSSSNDALFDSRITTNTHNNNNSSHLSTIEEVRSPPLEVELLPANDNVVPIVQPSITPPAAPVSITATSSVNNHNSLSNDDLAVAAIPVATEDPLAGAPPVGHGHHTHDDENAPHQQQ
jgi:hypothetical protein